MNETKQTDYKYPLGDFLSGFSDDSNNPCDYELECQRMVIRGVQYLDENPDVFELISNGGVKTSDKIVKPMIDFMCHPEDGQTGAMVGHTVKVAYHAKKLGWDEYIRKITEKRMTNNKQQTAMQMAIAHYKKLSEEGSNQAYLIAKFLEENFLEMEKEQMIDAYWDGGHDVPLHINTCEEWYKRTYGGNK